MQSLAYAECHMQVSFARCHYPECRYAECRGGLAYFATPSVTKKNSFITLTR